MEILRKFINSKSLKDFDKIIKKIKERKNPKSIPKYINYVKLIIQKVEEDEMI